MFKRDWIMVAAVLAGSLVVGSAFAVDGPQTSAPGVRIVDQEGRYIHLGHFGDPSIAAAINQIRVTDGVIIDQITKGKSLVKFGRTRNADAGVKTTVAEFQDAVVNETFVETNIIDSVASTSTADDGVDSTITIEGHTCASGVKTFVVQDVVLDGQTEATLGTPLCRATRAYVKNGTFASPTVDLVGDVSVYDNTGVTLTAGKIDLDAQVHLMIKGTNGKNQSEKAATSLSSTDYWVIEEMHASLARGGPANATVDVDIEIRELGGVWRQQGTEIILEDGTEQFVQVVLDPLIIVKPNSDVRCVATSDTADSFVGCRLEGYLLSAVDTE